MIFFIKNKILEDAMNYQENLEYLLDSFYRGHHIIDFESPLLVSEKLLPLFSQNTNILKAINSYMREKQNISSLRRTVEQYVEVGVGDYKVRPSGRQKIIEVNILYFDSDIRPSLILSENLHDGDFYASILYNAQHFNHTPLSKEVKFSFDGESGGGVTTSQVLQRRISEKRVILCIADSDKKKESDIIQGTAGKILGDMKKLVNDSRIVDVYILSVREKENLIPPTLYLKCNSFSSYRALIHLANLDSDKEKLLKFLKLSVDSPKDFKTKNSEFFATLSLTDEMRGIGKDGLRKFAASKVYTEEFVLAHKDLIKSDETVSNSNLIDIYEEIPEYLKEDYKNIIEKLYSYVCSLGRVRI